MLKPESDFLNPFHTDEFLPPIRRWTTMGAIFLVGALAGTVGVAAVTEYNVMVQAPATVRPLDGLGFVQVVNGGTVRRILVRENQFIRKGEGIAEIGNLEESQLQALQNRRDRLQASLQQSQSQLNQINAQLGTLNREILTRSEVNTAGKSLDVSIPELEAALSRFATLDPNGAKQVAANRDRLLQQRTGLTNQIQNDQTTLKTIDNELSQQLIQAPIDGTILKLMLRNPGQTLNPGDTVAQIVPQNVALVIKAQVSPQDISQVEVGQNVQLRISAYPYPDYGVLNGTVRTVAPDVATTGDASTGSTAPYYEVVIQPDQTFLIKGDRPYPLQPGMEARADIISHRETLLRSLLRKARLWSDL